VQDLIPEVFRELKCHIYSTRVQFTAVTDSLIVEVEGVHAGMRVCMYWY